MVQRNELCRDQGLATIDNKDECLKAAQCLVYPEEKLYFETETDSNYPSGCYRSYDEPPADDEFVVFFNYHQGGSRDAYSAPLCIW